MKRATDEGFRIVLVDWETGRPDLAPVRGRVFMAEQRVPPELEWDELDALSVHARASDASGRTVGTGRLTPQGRIGRMAVLPEWRGRGVGSALFRALLDAARVAGHRRVELDAQLGARGFYRRFGLEESGPVFMDAGIPHVHMSAALGPEDPGGQTG